MTKLEELEAQLRIEFDHDTLLVYADELLASGDPRGELITLDLSPDTDERAQRRAELIAAWLGPTPPYGTIRYGFLDIDATSAKPSEQLAAALDGPAARYVRGVTVVGDPHAIEGAVTHIGRAERPWLARVTLRQWPRAIAGTGPGVVPAPPDPGPLGGKHAIAFARATPALHSLEVDGRRVFDELRHKTVKRVRVSGYDAIASLHDGTTWPIHTLDFAFCAHLADKHDVPIDPSNLLPAARFPALRHLDLSRNEPGHADPHDLGGNANISGFVRALALRRQLVSLRLPRLRDGDDVANLRAALADMPALTTLDIRAGELRADFPNVRYFD